MPKTERQKLIERCDDLASEIVRRRAIQRANGCEKCLHEHTWKELQCCHFITRTIFNTRWDLENLVGLCCGCHRYLDRRPKVKEAWWRNLIGDDRVDLLYARERYTGKAELEWQEVYLRQELEKIRGQE